MNVKPMIYHYDCGKNDNGMMFELIKSNANNPVRGGGFSTGSYTESDVPEILRLTNWVLDKATSAVFDIVNQDGSSYYLQSDTRTRNFDLAYFWGMYYPKGGSVIKHNHFPSTVNCCYYIKAPEGCSPLIVEGQKIEVKESMLIVFPGCYMHEVPEWEVEGRCMINFDVVYTAKEKA